MDQFDNTFNKMKQPNRCDETTSVLILGTEVNTVDAIRATLESHGHQVVCAKTTNEYEELAQSNVFGMVFVSTDSDNTEPDLIFESVSLLSPTTIIVGYSTNPNYSKAMTFIRSGGSDLFCVPVDLSSIGERIAVLLNQQFESATLESNAKKALRLCDKINEERHRVAQENDSLNNELANAHCETQKKLQQVAIGAEFQTLVSQELEVESMLRTALEYMLTRIGATNAAVYLREGSVDWGIGAYINFDRQSEQFQSLIDTIGPAVCPTVANEETTNRYTNGETFANNMDLDQIDFSGNEIVTCSCFYEDRCMAVIVLFRDETRKFDNEVMNTIETIQTIFGKQLGTILKIHRRAESHWPSESIDDDDWSADKAA